MTEKDKAAERSTLILALGKILRPLYDLAEKVPAPSQADFQLASARGIVDCQRWNAQVSRFATIGGYPFGILVADITRGPHNLMHDLSQWAKSIEDDASRQRTLRDAMEQCQQQTLQAIDRVPIEWTSRLHEAKSPFSVYLDIRDAISTAKRRIHYFDRYLDLDFFHLHLRDISRTLEVRLVTTRGNARYGVFNVLHVSRRAAAEFSNYQLIDCQPSELHDRNLRVDETVFVLGTSIKDAGTQPTNFSLSDCTPTGHAVLDKIIASGTVVT